MKDATRPLRVKPLSPEKIKQVVHMTLHEKPSKATYWSGRSMAAAASIPTAGSNGSTDLACGGLKSHQHVQGLARQALRREGQGYDLALSRSAGQAMVLCVDEKIQI
ncbi:hypothetical protein ACVWWO_003486 [Bradyrhizobium sp. F1.13.1]